MKRKRLPILKVIDVSLLILLNLLLFATILQGLETPRSESAPGQYIIKFKDFSQPAESEPILPSKARAGDRLFSIIKFLLGLSFFEYLFTAV